jgi:hypothetical protein
VLVEYRWSDGHYERLSTMSADLVPRQVAELVANTPAVPVAKAATATIPIVFTTAIDPVEAGFVASLSRPGGNLTGVTMLNVEGEPMAIPHASPTPGCGSWRIPSPISPDRSANALAAKLNERHVPTARGGRWTHVQVAAVLARTSV